MYSYNIITTLYFVKFVSYKDWAFSLEQAFLEFYWTSCENNHYCEFFNCKGVFSVIRSNPDYQFTTLK